MNVGPVVRADESPAPTASDSEPLATPIPPEETSVEVRNGTKTAGLAGTTASGLKSEYAWIVKTSASDASKNIYTGTTLVDLSKGAKPGALAALEEEFGVKAVSTLPQGEASSTADFVVILGTK